MAKKVKKNYNRTKEIILPMEFKPALNKFVPELPLRKGPAVVEKNGNNWAFWFVVIMIALLASEFIYFLIQYLNR